MARWLTNQKSYRFAYCFCPVHSWKFVELQILTVLPSLTRAINRKAAHYTCIVQVLTLHWLHSLHLPACSGFPSRSAPQPGVSTEEGCHHCLPRKETQGCSCPPAAVRLGHLCSLKGIYTYQIFIFCYVFALETRFTSGIVQTTLFWSTRNTLNTQHSTLFI